MKVQNVSIDKIKPYENNPRDNEAGVDAVANSIDEFGWQQPIVVDENNVIIVGHTRYLAAKKLGLKEVPVKVATGLTPEQIKAYRLADNKTGELTDWDKNLLDNELNNILSIDMSDFGFDFDNKELNITDDTQEDKTSVSTKHMKACGYDIEMSEDEYIELKKYIEKYVDENGVTFGIVRSLLDDEN